MTYVICHNVIVNELSRFCCFKGELKKKKKCIDIRSADFYN